MTVAWYGHLKFFNKASAHSSTPIWAIILLSWGIAFFEYCFMVPANRYGYTDGFNGFQLKMVQEVITLTVFCVFAILFLKEPLRWNYVWAALCLVGAVYFVFRE